jgi:ABC-type transport system involved in multi-copper enzyme maturation permease subunit
MESTDADPPRTNPLVFEERNTGGYLFSISFYVGGVLVFFAVEAGWFFGRGSLSVAAILLVLIFVFACVFCMQLVSSFKFILDDFEKKRNDAREEMELGERATAADLN